MNEGALEDVLAAVARGRAEGGPVVAGGGRIDEQAYLVAPTVFEDVGTTPTSPARRCSGLSSPSTASPTSTRAAPRQRARVRPLGRDLHARPPGGAAVTTEAQAGILHVNSQTAGADVHVPFGGIKGSGWGPHEQGRAAIEFCTHVVTVYQDAPAS